MPVRHIALMTLLMACGILVVGQLYITIPLTAEIATRFDVPMTSASLAGSAFGLAYAAGFLVFGPMSDRFGRRRILVTGLLATTVATAAVGLANSFGLLIGARALQGFVAAAIPPTALSLVTETLAPKDRSLGVSLMSFAFLSAAPLAQLAGAQGAAEGTGTVMLGLAPFYAVGAVGLLLVLDGGFRSRGRAPSPSPSLSPSPRRTEPWARPMAGLLADRVVVASWSAAATVLFGFVVFFAGMAALAPASNARADIDLDMLRLAAIPPLLMTFAAAPIARRFGTVTAAIVGLLMAAAGSLLTVGGSPAWLVAASMLLTGGVAIAVPGLIGTIAARAKDTNRGLALAVYTFTLFVGAAIAPPVAQALAHAGLPALALVPAGVLAMGAGAVWMARASTRTPKNALSM